MVTLHTTYGDIVIELNEEKAPLTVANFLEYARSGFYNDTIFHRVIDGFMIQGGGFNVKMEQKDASATIQNEADNGLTNDAGTLAMARTSDPNSASAQFFINVADNAFLNHRAKTNDGWGYAVFGKVSTGMEVIDKIRAVKTGSKQGHQDVPLEPVLIERVTVE